MKLIVISSSDSREQELEHIRRLFEMGLPTMHLRKPKLSTAEMKKFIEGIPEPFHERIMLHSHHNLALHFKLKGIHITRLHKKRWLRLRWNEFLFKMKGRIPERSCSFRKLSSLYETPDTNYNYVFLSPIFDSLSGTIQGGFNEFSLRAALQKTGHRVIARGGIALDRMEKVREIGFSGLAFYSAIWRKKDPSAAFEAILKEGQARGITFT